jgi:hypothetical protein
VRKSLAIYLLILAILCATVVVGTKTLGQQGNYLAGVYMLTPALADFPGDVQRQASRRRVSVQHGAGVFPLFAGRWYRRRNDVSARGPFAHLALGGLT